VGVLAVTIADAIRWAQQWLEAAKHPASTEECERAANAFAFALTALYLERSMVLDQLAEAGFKIGPLRQRVQEAIAYAKAHSSTTRHV
jgi:hypothetical protein